jgi:hypothetical protein
MTPFALDEGSRMTSPPMPPGPAVATEISWEIEVPLLNNRDIVGTTLAVFAISVLITGSFVGMLLAAQGEWDAIMPVVGMLALVAGVLFGIGLLAMVLIYRGDMRFRFTVSDQHIRSEMIDRTARAVNRLAIVAGFLTGRPGALGTGLIATSGEETTLGWDGGFRATCDPKRRTIALRNSWRRLLVVYCTEQNYEAVAAFVRARIAAAGTERRVASRSPLPRMLAFTALAVIASLVTFPLTDISEVPLFLLFLMLCFAVAMIWLVSLFGYVVLGCIVAAIAFTVADAVGIQDSYLFPGETYRRLSVFSDDDWVGLGIAGIGLVVLGVLAFRAIRGRLPSMLERDAESAGG